VDLDAISLNAVKGIRIISEVIRLELQRNVRLKLDVVSAEIRHQCHLWVGNSK
jgi:hypothetical protein